MSEPEKKESQKAGGGGGFGGFWNKATAFASQAVESARPGLDKVKEKASQIDTSKMYEVVQQVRAQASDTLQHARTAADPHLAKAREAVDQQAKAISKVNTKSLLNANAQFGVPLEALCMRDDSGAPTELARVPPILELMLARLEATEESEFVVDGRPLFSVPPNHQVVKGLAKSMDTSLGSVNLSIENPHTVAALLRQWLVELPEPILTHDLYDACIKASISEDTATDLKVALKSLPMSQTKTAKRLVAFLAKIAEKGKVDMSTLTLSFGPALLRPKRHGGVLRNLMEDLPAICASAEVIIKAGDAIYPGEELPI